MDTVETPAAAGVRGLEEGDGGGLSPDGCVQKDSEMVFGEDVGRRLSVARHFGGDPGRVAVFEIFPSVRLGINGARRVQAALQRDDTAQVD
jgi:hypothetical protein